MKFNSCDCFRQHPSAYDSRTYCRHTSSDHELHDSLIPALSINSHFRAVLSVPILLSLKACQAVDGAWAGVRSIENGAASSRGAYGELEEALRRKISRIIDQL